ncbi:MAG: acylphosphatase [Candidatus Omnitrophota bacterium]
MESRRVHVLIAGIVQGVFFRSFMKEKAQELGVKGWVKNRVDGTLESVMEGKKDAVDELISWCRKGPPMADVDYIHLEREDFRDEFKSFNIEY